MRRRILWAAYLAVALSYVPHIARPLVSDEELANTDVVPFATGWRLVLDEPAFVYDRASQAEVQTRLMGGGGYVGGPLPFLHPPHAALVLAPLGLLSLRSAFVALLLLSGAALVLLVRQVARLSGVDTSSERITAILAMLAFLPLLTTLEMGQVSVLVALGLAGFAVAMPKDERAGGLWLLLVSIKPHLVAPCLAYLLLAKRWRALAWFAGGAAVLVGATTWVLGAEVWGDYGRLVGEVMVTPEGLGGAHPSRMLTVRGLVARLGLPRSEHAVTLVVAVTSGAALGCAGVLGAKASRPALALMVAVALVLAPHLYTYDATAWIVPMAAWVGELRRSNDRAARGFERLALAWPVMFLLGAAVEALWPHAVPVFPLILPVLWAVAWMARSHGRMTASAAA